MSANKRKNVVADEKDDDSETSSDDDSPHPDAYTGNEEVVVDFEGRAPIDPDCHGISQLLQRVFLKGHVNCMQMADLIIAQNFVGSVICQCDADEIESDTDDMCEDETIFGITTVLNITSKKAEPAIKELCSFVINKAEKYATDSVLKHFRDALSNETRAVGYLINERFINIPPQISVPLLENLHKEIITAKQKGMPYEFVYFLMIVKFHRKDAKKNKSKEDIFTNAEEEVLAEKAICSFEYSVADESDMGMSGDWLEGDATLTPYRKVFLLDTSNFSQLISDIQNFISGQ